MSSKKCDVVVSLRMPEDLDAKVMKAARRTKLKKSDVLRLAVDRGVDMVLAQLLEKKTTAA